MALAKYLLYSSRRLVPCREVRWVCDIFWFILEFEIVPKEMHEFDSHGTVWMGARATNQLVYDEGFP